MLKRPAAQLVGGVPLAGGVPIVGGVPLVDGMLPTLQASQDAERKKKDNTGWLSTKVACHSCMLLRFPCATMDTMPHTIWPCDPASHHMALKPSITPYGLVTQHHTIYGLETQHHTIWSCNLYSITPYGLVTQHHTTWPCDPASHHMAL